MADEKIIFSMNGVTIKGITNFISTELILPSVKLYSFIAMYTSRI